MNAIYTPTLSTIDRYITELQKENAKLRKEVNELTYKVNELIYIVKLLCNDKQKFCWIAGELKMLPSENNNQ